MLATLFSFSGLIQSQQAPGGPIIGNEGEENARVVNQARTVKFLNQTESRVYVWIPTAQGCWHSEFIGRESGIMPLQSNEAIYIYTPAGAFLLTQTQSGSRTYLNLSHDRSSVSRQNIHSILNRNWDDFANILVTIRADGSVTFDNRR